MTINEEVVLVTGSSGCLGQHIVKLLQERDDRAKEIRLFDLVPYENKLGHSEEKRMIEFVGDIRRPEEFLPALEGVDCVIHCAAYIDLRRRPDVRHLKSINIDGTQAVIDGCIEKSVARLVFASTTEMVCGTEHIFYGTESTTPIPKKFMIGPYGETKCIAEKLVLEANGKRKIGPPMGTTILRTVSLRPTPFYGEQDRHFIIQFMKQTQLTNGFYYRVKSLDERLQISYVGNVAWAFVKAKNKLAIDPYISGEAFFITDDTPIIDVHEHISPYLRARGFGISTYVIPYWVAWIFLTFACFFLRFCDLVFPGLFDIEIPSVNCLNYVCSTFFYNRSKATLRLDYEPIYTPFEAKHLSLAYYENCQIK